MSFEIEVDVVGAIGVFADVSVGVDDDVDGGRDFGTTADVR